MLMDFEKRNILNNNWQFILCLFFLFSLLSCQLKNKEKENFKINKGKPNVLLILTDDQAYGDLSFTGNQIAETPNLDRLALEGAFFTNFYVSPVCAPTRASLLTGRYHQRTGVNGVTRGRENMNLNEVTLADILKENGYQTGIFGKWHNGAHYPYHPMGRGFNAFVGFTSGHWSSYFDTTIEKDGKPFLAKGYLSDVLTTEALDFIKRSVQNEEPFFCYIPYQTPHTPLQIPDAYFDKYKNKGADDFNAAIYGMTENIDDNVNRLIQGLEELDIREETIIIYLSDNGPLNLRFNQGLKGRKGQVDEGGVRVPFIMNWKGQIKPGKTVKYPVAHIDVLPTLLGMLDIEYTADQPLDGLDIKKLFQDESLIKSRNLYSEWGGNKRVLSGDYLMINEALFNLNKDPNQTLDMRERSQDTYDSLRKSYDYWINNMPISKTDNSIPVGYHDFPRTVLPAHEANLFPSFEFRKDRKHTGIAYHSLYGWAHDWIDFWTNTNAFPSWIINVVSSGRYELKLKYALESENKGTSLRIEIQDQERILNDVPVFEHSLFKNHDRVARTAEAPETNWGILDVGIFNLEAGQSTIKIQAIEIPGEESIELKELILRRID